MVSLNSRAAICALFGRFLVRAVGDVTVDEDGADARVELERLEVEQRRVACNVHQERLCVHRASARQKLPLKTV